MQDKKKLGNLILIVSLLVFVTALQFILGQKQLQYGFFIDDWLALGWYKQFVTHPFLDIPNAWKAAGSHNFIHTYYIGALFEIFQYNYSLYHILNTFLKALAVISFFPFVYILFKNKLLAFLAVLIYAIHFSPFGVIFHVIGGEDSIVVICLNLFLALFIYSSQKHYLNNLKILLLLFILFLSFVISDIPRTYPVALMLPFLELFNFLLNKSSTSVKSSLLRLIFFYSPFIAIILYSPDSALHEIFISDKLTHTFNQGNLQLILTIFASFGSNFIPKQIWPLFGNPDYLHLETFIFSLLSRMSLIFGFAYIVMGILVNSSNFILRSLFFSLFFSLLAFWAANHWLYLDPSLKSSVDPGVFFIPALIGLFIFSSALSFLLSWLKSNRKNLLLLTLPISTFFSFLYILLTWILVEDNTIFMGVHAYLNIPALGSSLFMAILLYLAIQNLKNNQLRLARKFASILTIIYFFFFFILSVKQIDEFFSFWLKNGFAASDEELIRQIFWKEVGTDKNFSYQNPALFYIDTSEDYDNGYYYSNVFIWKIPYYLLVNSRTTLENCDLIAINENIEKLRVEIIGGKKVLVYDKCGHEMIYPPDNFYAFKLKDRTIYPNREEVLKKLGI